MRNEKKVLNLIFDNILDLTFEIFKVDRSKGKVGHRKEDCESCKNCSLYRLFFIYKL